MATRWQLTVVAMCTLLATPSAHADIYRWDTREVIPGTDEIWWLGDGAELDHMELEFAALMDRGLRSANFEESNLRGAWMSRSWLNNANLSAVNLADADLENADLTDANLTGANLTNAYLRSSRLTNANLTGANLTNADLLYAATDGTDLSGAVVIEALFGGWGLTQEQLYSTASYQTKNLQGVGFSGVDLTGWDFSGQDLTNGGFASCWLTDVDMSGAIVTGATLIPAGAEHFTKEQLYSTASYQAKNLRRVDLSFNDVTGWDFSGQDLTNGGFYATTLTSANLTGANLRNVDFRRAIGNLQSAILDSTTIYNQWTRFPSEFDPAEAGMTLVPSPTGDLNADDALDMTDVDWLTNRILERSTLGYRPLSLTSTATARSTRKTITSGLKTSSIRGLATPTSTASLIAATWSKSSPLANMRPAGLIGGGTFTTVPAGPKATGMPTASLTPAIWSQRSSTAAMRRDRGPMQWPCRSRVDGCCW